MIYNGQFIYQCVGFWDMGGSQSNQRKLCKAQRAQIVPRPQETPALSILSLFHPWWFPLTDMRLNFRSRSMYMGQHSSHCSNNRIGIINSSQMLWGWIMLTRGITFNLTVKPNVMALFHWFSIHWNPATRSRQQLVQGWSAVSEIHPLDIRPGRTDLPAVL